jgi:HK97 family phage prohead protease
MSGRRHPQRRTPENSGGAMQQRTRTIDLDRRAIDPDARTIKATLSTEQPVDRFGESEVLEHSTKAINFERASSGLPLLFAHDQRQPVGVAENIRLEGRELKATLRFSRSAKGDEVLRDVADGVLRHLSIGYRIDATENTPNGYRATRWTPMEASVVSVPADHNAQIGRSFTMDNERDDNMTRSQRRAAREAEEQQQRADQRAAIIERQRITGITDAVRAAKLPDELAEQMIADGTPIEAARAAVLAKRGERPQPKEPTHIGITSDQSEKTRAAGEAWMLHRANEKVPQGALNGNPFRGMSMLDMARDSLERAGVRTRGLLAREIAQRAISHSTSDFPIIFQNVMHKTLVAAYTAVPDVWRTFCRVGTLSDFRPHYRYRPGSFGNLSTVAENGTYTYGTLPDAERESITGATKGKLLNLSRQMIINDDLGTFTDAARAMGRGAARTVEADVFTLLAANPTMGDTGALFNATVESTAGGHANLNASGAAPTVAGFDAVRQAMGAHLDVGGNDYVAARPAVWVGPLAHEGQANVVNESQYDIDQSNKTSYYPNKSRGMLRQIVGTPRLTGNIWYVFADPNEEPVIEVAFLDGEQAPYVEMQDGFEVDGVTWKVRLDYAVGAVGWRGGYKVTW